MASQEGRCAPAPTWEASQSETGGYHPRASEEAHTGHQRGTYTRTGLPRPMGSGIARGRDDTHYTGNRDQGRPLTITAIGGETAALMEITWLAQYLEVGRIEPLVPISFDRQHVINHEKGTITWFVVGQLPEAIDGATATDACMDAGRYDGLSALLPFGGYIKLLKGVPAGRIGSHQISMIRAKIGTLGCPVTPINRT